MPGQPKWLPPEIAGLVWDGNTLSQLYSYFDKDFRIGQPRYKGIRVGWDDRISPGDKYEEGFYHLITEDNGAGSRYVNLKRARRLPWCAPIITNADEIEVLAFDYKEGNKEIRTYVWIPELDYLVILLKKPNRKWGTVAFLITAFTLDGDNSRRKMRLKYDNRIR